MKKTSEKTEKIEVTAPNFKIAEFTIRGTVPYVQNKFSQKAKDEMKHKQEAGEKSKSTKKRTPKDFKQVYKDAMYISENGGWNGINARSFRSAMISACRVAGVVMTQAKLFFSIEPDGFDKNDGTPLVKIIKGEPHYWEAPVRLPQGGTDIHPRPMWNPGWEANVRVKYDSDIVELKSIANLLVRAGLQVGIGEGRPDSRKSSGMGFGLFEVIEKES